MNNEAKTVRDRLGDPASWPSVPDDFAPPNESYLLAKLASVVADGSDVQIYFWSGDEGYANILDVHDPIEAERIVARLQPRIGDLAFYFFTRQMATSTRLGPLATFEVKRLGFLNLVP